MDEALAVEVVYARAEQQHVLRLELAPGSTLEQALRLSGLLERFPEIDLGTSTFGVFGKPTSPASPLRAGDRVEIYRPLLIDPRESRRRRAKRGVPPPPGQAGR